MKLDSVRAPAYLVVAVVLWGTSFAVTKYAYAALPPMTVVWLRMVLAAVVCVPLVWRAKRPTYVRGDAVLLGLAGLFLPCLYFLGEGYAIRFTTSSQAGVVAAVLPLIVALLAWAVLRERPTPRTWVAIVVSMAGVAVLSLAGAVEPTAPHPVLGNLLELGAMAAGAGSTLVIKRLSGRYDPVVLTGWQMLVGAVFFAPLGLTSGPIHWAAVPASAWLAIAYLGLGCGVGAFTAYNAGLKRVSASRAALTVNLIPAVALLLGWLALGEALVPVQLVASLVIIGAVVYSSVPPRPTQAGQTP